jgi:ribosomal protein S18 acetylase RimI-like enzyme
VARVHVLAWQSGYRDILPAELLASLSVEERTGRWRRQLAESRTWVVSAPAGPVLGFVSVGPSRDEDAPPGDGEVYALYVHPDTWGTGVGSRLLTTAAEHLATAHTGATLWVLERNERARAFYERHGWRPDGAHRQETRAAALLEELRYRLGR